VVFSGVNVRIVNGRGSTDCLDERLQPIPDCPNGLGNLIVGYNESRREEEGENIRTGSHNVVVGKGHNFSRVGGIVVGVSNTISGDFAAVSGGRLNTANSHAAAVSGGHENTASGVSAAVSGGQGNTASNFHAAVSGGQGNTASGDIAAVSGGESNTASGTFAAVSGGEHNVASGLESSISGGRGNVVEGGANHASISGGSGITQNVVNGWAAGSVGDELVGSFRSP
jgi:hypothetical protein